MTNVDSCEIINQVMIEPSLLQWESYVDELRIGIKLKVMKWEDFKALLKSQFYPIFYEEKHLMKWKYIQQEQGQGVQEYTLEFQNKSIHIGISLEDPRVVVKYLGGIFGHIQRKLQFLNVKIINDASKKVLYIEMDSKKGKQQQDQEEIQVSYLFIPSKFLTNICTKLKSLNTSLEEEYIVEARGL